MKKVGAVHSLSFFYYTREFENFKTDPAAFFDFTLNFRKKTALKVSSASACPFCR